MAHLYRDTSVKSLYADRKCEGGKEGWADAILRSSTLYVGNLSFYTTEEQLYDFFGRAGKLSRIVMGLDRFSKTPCGFCFVEYSQRSGAEDAMRFLNGLKLDERIVRVDWDGGFVEGRQYGRGRSGGQVRDEYRQDFDAARGGWGKLDSAPVDMGKPRRRSFVGISRRDDDGAPAGDDDEPGAKRAKADGEAAANPRFREDGAEDEDEDD